MPVILCLLPRHSLSHTGDDGCCSTVDVGPGAGQTNGSACWRLGCVAIRRFPWAPVSQRVVVSMIRQDRERERDERDAVRIACMCP